MNTIGEQSKVISISPFVCGVVFVDRSWKVNPDKIVFAFFCRVDMKSLTQFKDFERVRNFDHD